MTSTILQKIVETKCAEVAAARLARPIETVQSQARSTAAPRDFFRAVTNMPGIRLIAEIKKASPSAGLIRADFDPVKIARTYESAGAAALSVLTDKTYFQGDLQCIAPVKAAVSIPVLRKDFIIDDYQVYESRAAGADAILLIAAILTVPQIERFSSIAADLGMASLMEVHDAEELDAVKGLVDSRRRVLLGINNRDLAVQRVDLATTKKLAARIPGVPFVSESGLQTRTDVLAMRDAGACAVLIGESFMREANIAEKVRELMPN